jgi:hypothetical protein
MIGVHAEPRGTRRNGKDELEPRRRRGTEGG